MRKERDQKMFRKMRRFKQELDRQTCIEILLKEKRGVLAVHGDEGYPYALPLDYYYDEENGKIYFHGAGQGHKIDAIARDPRVSFCVYEKGVPDEGGWFLYVRSVIVFGQMRIVTDPQEKLVRARRLGIKYYPDAQSVEEEIRKDGARMTCLELTIDHMTGKRVHEQ